LQQPDLPSTRVVEQGFQVSAGHFARPNHLRPPGRCLRRCTPTRPRSKRVTYLSLIFSDESQRTGGDVNKPDLAPGTPAKTQTSSSTEESKELYSRS